MEKFRFSNENYLVSNSAAVTSYTDFGKSLNLSQH